MSRTAVAALFVSLLWARAALAEVAPLRRYALLVATNDGGEGRVRLRYAVSDARSFAGVLTELGGVERQDAVLLEEADRAGLVRALAELRGRLQRARDKGHRTEAILYFSGHSDEQGLLLGADRFAFPDLRKELESLPADVRVAILDSCASGALARRKGGVRRPAFLLDASTDVRGQAILTSSSADEASQESDRIGASFFTHHLVSGLRGAADASGDGKVTLGEAYQFAFRETLARTERTQAGAQHAVYDIDLAGSGELVLTDLRAQEAGLLFARDVEGRLFVRDGDERLVVELRKAAGETVEVGLAEGRYSVFRQDGSAFARANVNVPPGARVTVSGGQFASVGSELTVSRGAAREHRFLNLGLVPLLQTNDLLGSPVQNNFSLGLIVGRSAQVHGVGIGAAGQWIDGDANGLQLAGAFNGVGGDAVGLQLVGAANFNRGSLTGAQLAGAFNHAGSVRGLQLAAAANHTAALTGMQLGVVNVGGDVTGVQLGVVNIGSRVRGLQLGVINLGGQVDGASVGILSFVRDGQFHLEAFASDLAVANLGVKLGSRHVHTLFGAGRLYAVTEDGEAWTTSLGLGAHLPFDRWFADTDLVATLLHDAGLRASNKIVYQLRVIGGYSVTKDLSLIAGPTLNVAHRFGHATPPEPSLAPTWRVGRAAVWPGLQLGIRY